MISKGSSRCRRGPQAQTHHDRLTRGDGYPPVRRRLGPGLGRIRPAGSPVHHPIVDSILGVAGVVALVEQAFDIGVVVVEQQRRLALDVQLVGTQPFILRLDDAGSGDRQHLLRFSLQALQPPAPGIAEPQGRQEMQLGLFVAAIGHRDADAGIVGGRLGIGDIDLEIPIPCKDPGVDQLEFRLMAGAGPVGRHQLIVREGRLRILVAHVQQGMAR